ncbi:MAG TPA: tetratricopeptide repeat protein [Terriglobales bacterium]|nr:tetratricopeptide repeat protein [Terriglobales bacterium]
MSSKRVLPLVSLLFLFLLLAATAFGQGHTSTPAPPSTITRPDSIQDSGLYNYWADMTAQGRAGGALLGKVAVEGEPLPWEPLLVTVSCDGKVAYTTQTDAKGNFGIVAMTLPGAMGKQGDAERQLVTQYEGCVVQGSVPGFRSTSITLTQHNLRDDPQLGTLMLSRVGRDAATTLSTTTDTASPKAIKSFEGARGKMLQSDPDGAQKELEKTVKIDPQFAEAWLQLGKMQEASDPQSARNSFSKALAADPNFVLPYEQLAALAAQSGNWQEVLNNTDHALKLYPEGTPEMWYLDALANYQLKKPDIAEASAMKSLALDPRHSVMNTEQLLAVILARKGDLAGALTHLQSSLKYLPPGPNADMVKQQIAQLGQRATTK